MFRRIRELVKAHWQDWLFFLALTVAALFLGRHFGEIISGLAVLALYLLLASNRVKNESYSRTAAIVGGIISALAVFVWWQFIL